MLAGKDCQNLVTDGQQRVVMERVLDQGSGALSTSVDSVTSCGFEQEN